MVTNGSNVSNSWYWYQCCNVGNVSNGSIVINGSNGGNVNNAGNDIIYYQ